MSAAYARRRYGEWGHWGVEVEDEEEGGPDEEVWMEVNGISAAPFPPALYWYSRKISNDV